jgi:hypothetical protein
MMKTGLSDRVRVSDLDMCFICNEVCY